MKTFVIFLLFAMVPWLSLYSQPVSDEVLLKLYKGLRVADVSDGMDAVGLPGRGLMDPAVEALWKNIDNFSHMFCGIAVTVRYVPSQREFPTNLRGADYDRWVGEWYNKLSPEPFLDSLSPGTVLVIDNAGNTDAGTVGSNNIMIWKKHGMNGLVSNGGVRDTDEIIKQQIPVYMELANRGRGIRPGRNEVESVNKPVVIGGVTVFPGDVVVADGDGVVVVPRQHAVAVAETAHLVLKSDKDARKRLYKELGIPMDFTVE